MIRVHGDVRSGNCLKVRWLLDWLNTPYEWIPVDVLAGETRTPRFLGLNPAGQIPFVELEDGRGLAQSNAILLHFSEGGPLLPDDPWLKAKVWEWLFWEQYSHEPAIAVRRFQKLYLGRQDPEIDPQLLDRGRLALSRMEIQLSASEWLVGRGPTAADLALLPYTALAPEGGFSLDHWPAVRRWIDRSLTAFDVDPSALGTPTLPLSSRGKPS